jgi:valyl-tRNA synthetase
MPFMTEELWAATFEGKRDTLLCHADWPQSTFHDDKAADEINWLISLVSEIRSVRAEMNIKPGLRLPMVVTGASSDTKTRLTTNDAAIKTLARMESIAVADEAPKASAQMVLGEATICLPLEGIIDLSAEVVRLTKEQGILDKEIKQLSGKLRNEKFVANAPKEVVQENRDRLAGAEAKKEKIEAALERMG